MNDPAKTLSGTKPTCAPPDHNPTKPRNALPPLACDAHFHLFGPAHRFPFAADRTFTPPDAGKKDLLNLHRFLGFERGVFIQAACHGSDHSAVLDALRGLNDRYRAVALLDASTTASDVKYLNHAGFVGARFHFVSHFGRQPPDEIRRIIGLVAPFDWHVAIHTMHNGLAEHYDFIKSIAAPVVIDHIGRFDIGDGESSPGFQALRRLLDRGNVWVKLSGIDRLSKQPPHFQDAIPFARMLAEQAPERILWGSDWPHPNQKPMPNDGHLVDLISEVVVDKKTRQLMLVDNPAKLFGFSDLSPIFPGC